MRLLLLRDSRPGHFRQSEGVALALKRLGPVEAIRVAARPQLPFRGRLLRAAAPPRLSPERALKLVYGIDPTMLGRPDVIVSAGADTLVANVAAQEITGAPNLFIGSLRNFPEDAFAAILHTLPCVARRPRHILVTKPCPFDPDDLPRPRRLDDVGALRGASAALLVGGPSGSHRWSAADWDDVERLVRQTHERFGLVWTATGSRRTPARVAERLAALAEPGGPLARFVDYRSAGSGSADSLFAADLLVVTEDSATMMMEGVSARRPVVGLVPRRRFPSRDDEATAHLEREGRLVRLALAESDAGAMSRAVLACRPLDENPLDRLARQIAPALGIRFP